MIAHPDLVLFQQQADDFWAHTLDEFRSKGGTVACEIGCHYCCKAYAQCSESEADLIAAFLLADDERLETLEARIDAYLHEIAAKWSEIGWEAVKDFETRVNAHFTLDMDCPFLVDDRRCAIYAIRPYACRSHWAAGDNENCKSPSTVSNVKKIYPTAESSQRFIEGIRQSGRTREYANYDQVGSAISRDEESALIAMAVKNALVRKRKSS